MQFKSPRSAFSLTLSAGAPPPGTQVAVGGAHMPDDPRRTMLIDGESYRVLGTGPLDFAAARDGREEVIIVDMDGEVGFAFVAGIKYEGSRRAMPPKGRRETGRGSAAMRVVIRLAATNGAISTTSRCLGTVMKDDHAVEVPLGLARDRLYHTATYLRQYCGIPTRMTLLESRARPISAESRDAGPFRQTILVARCPVVVRIPWFFVGRLQPRIFRLLPPKLQDKLLDDPEVINDPDEYRAMHI